MLVKRFKLQEVAPEIRTAWEREHECSLDQLQRRHLVGWRIVFTLQFLCITSALLTLISLIFTPSGVSKTMVALSVGFAVIIIIMATTAIVADNAEEGLRRFNRDILELKSKIGEEFVEDRRIAVREAEQLLCFKAVSIWLAELEHEQNRANRAREEMVQLYNFLAGLDLVPAPNDPEYPPLNLYFSGTQNTVKDIVKRMTRELGV